MILYNIVPENAISIKNPPPEDVERHVRNVSSFLEACIRLNGIEDFFVAHIVGMKSESRDWMVGQLVQVDDLYGIVALGIRDEVGIRVRSRSCRYFSFGYDYDAWICLKHADVIPKNSPGLIISDISEGLIKTDWYDH